MKTFILTLLALSTLAHADDIFLLKKSRNKLNVLHFDVKKDANCKFPKNAVSAYWIMGEDNGEVLGLNSKEKEYFQPKEIYNDGKEIRFKFGALKKMSDSIPKQEVEVHMENCKPVAYLDLDGQEIKLTEIFSNVNMLMMPIDFTVKGTTSSGSKFTKTMK